MARRFSFLRRTPNAPGNVPRLSRSYLWFLLAAALFMRAVLPQGYMPERTGSGAIAVVVCGSGAVHRIPVGDEGDEQQRAEPPCTFAGLAAPAVPAPALPELRFSARAALAHADLARVTAPFAAPHRHPPARGPPLTV
jgi:hypothetical protein